MQYLCVYIWMYIYIYTSNYRIPREKISLILGKALWHLTEKRTQKILNLEWLLKMKKNPNHQHLIPTWFYWTGFTSLPVSCWVQLTEVQQRLTGQMCCSGWAWHEDRSKWPLTAHTWRSVEVPLALPTWPLVQAASVNTWGDPAIALRQGGKKGLQEARYVQSEGNNFVNPGVVVGKVSLVSFAGCR